MRATWLRSMRSSLVATLTHPEWWAIALAGFLVRGGILLIALPIVTLPSPGQLTLELAPTINRLAFEGLTPARLLVSVLAAAGVASIVALAGVAGAWFDLVLVREAATDEDLRLPWRPSNGTARGAFTIRLTAHLPTIAALAYATVRLLYAGYAELLSPGNAAVPLVARVVERAPDTVVLVVVTWLIGETVGALAARRNAAGQAAGGALRDAARQLLRPRGLATLAISTAAVAAVVVPFTTAIGAAWDDVRVNLSGDVTAVQLAAALLVLVATWILGIFFLGAVLAWRSTAWTAEVVPPLVATPADTGLAPAPEPVAT